MNDLCSETPEEEIKPFSLLGTLGDEFAQVAREDGSPFMATVVEAIMLDSDLQNIRNGVKLVFARHFEKWKQSKVGSNRNITYR